MNTYGRPPWIWQNVPEDEFPWGDILYKNSSVETSDLVCGDRVEQTDAVVSVSLPDAKLADVQTQACLPTTLAAPLVGRKVRKTLEILVAPGKLQFIQARVRCQDGEAIEFRYVVVPVLRKCIDIQKSEGLNWVIANEMIVGAKKLRFVDGCLGDAEIARDTIYHPLVIVSERLRELLIETGVPTSAFCRVEAMEDIGFPA